MPPSIVTGQYRERPQPVDVFAVTGCHGINDTSSPSPIKAREQQRRSFANLKSIYAASSTVLKSAGRITSSNSTSSE
jgi:hypothetical protein